MNSAASPSRAWIVASTVSAVLLFAVWWLLIGFVAAVGTCGEDSDLDAADYTRLCGDTGSSNGLIFDVQVAIGAAAAIAGAGLGAAAVLGRRWWPVLVLCLLLAIGAVASFLVAV